MGNKEIKWLMYTVLVGLIPIICRILVWGVTQAGAINMLAASDVIAFGLVLHISNINEIEHLGNSNQSWKTVQNGISILFIASYSVLFTLTMLNESVAAFIDLKMINKCVMGLAAISFLISLSVFHRISTIQKLEANK